MFSVNSKITCPTLPLSLPQCVHITGGNLQFPQVEDRLHSDLMAMRPFQSSFALRPAGRSLSF